MTSKRRPAALWPVLVMIIALVPRPAHGQALPALAGAAGGMAAGAIVTVGWVVEQATFEEQFLHSPQDLISLTGSPLVLAPAAGFALGLADADLLRTVGVGAGTGLLAGVALGAGLGYSLGGDAQGAWAGGAMGAAVGVLAGITIAVIVDAGSGDDDPAASVARRTPRGVPVGLTLRF
jgi:hypothetical protein